MTDAPVLPDYGGACLSSVVPALLGRLDTEAPSWLPDPARGARQVVLLVLDGLGWQQLQASAGLAPTLASGRGGPITSVVPTTTATALTSITTGCPPARHGVVGYRVRVEGDDGRDDEVMNVLRWRTGAGDMRQRRPARDFQPIAPFGGQCVAAVTRTEFASTGFTAAHLAGTRLVGWSVPSTLVVELRRLLEEGESFVYAYYDGLDKVAHEHGLGEYYAQELRTVDRLVGDIIEVLPEGAALVVTSDHGQVEVGTSARLPGPELLANVELMSGEGRFRWLHARAGAVGDVLAAAEEAHGAEAWVRTRERIVDEGWFGGPLSPEVAGRLGDVALVAQAPVAFLDPADTGETRLLARHGSLTAAEMYVPWWRGRTREPTPGLARRDLFGRIVMVDDESDDKGTSEAPRPGAAGGGGGTEAVLVEPGEGPGMSDNLDGENPVESVEQPAKVMRIGSMVKQLLDEVRAAPLDEASRTRLREIHEQSIRELAGALSPDLAAELDRMALPFDEAVPSEAELRVAQAQLVGWLEGLFHGIQATPHGPADGGSGPALGDAPARPAGGPGPRRRPASGRLPLTPVIRGLLGSNPIAVVHRC